MKLYDKIKWVLGILMIVTLVITTNLVDRNNFLKINAAMETIYKDRLVAKDLIFKISNLVHKKEVAAIMVDSSFYSIENERINSEIEGYLKSYDQTKLTIEEKRVLNYFKSDYNDLKEKEFKYVESDFSRKSSLLNQFPKVKSNLQDLAQIQLKEGSRQLQISKKASDTVELFTQIEIFIIIFLAIVVQIIVMYKPKSN